MGKNAAIIVAILTVAASTYGVVTASSYLLHIPIIGILAIFLVVGLSEYRQRETPEGFFLCDRRMPKRYFVWTFVTTNIGFFNSVAYSALLAYYYGVAGIIWLTGAWFLGMYWFSTKIPQLLPFLKKGHTLHQFIADGYGKTVEDKKRLRMLTSIVTSSLLWASIAIEVKFGSIALLPVIGLNSSVVLAVLIACCGTMYCCIAGYRGAVHTDCIQGWIMTVGSVAILLGCGLLATAGWTGVPDFYFKPAFMVLGPDPLSLASMVILFVPFQFCTMDMWQRCIAVIQSGEEVEQVSDSEKVRMLQKLVFRQAIPPFVFFFAVWYILGFTVLGTQLTDDPTQIVQLFVAEIGQMGWEGRIIVLLAFIVFVSAMISTIDTLLVALTQTFMLDVYAAVRTKYMAVVEGKASVELKAKFVDASRVFIVVFGLSAIIIAFFQVDLLYFWVGMYSLMLAMFPVVYVQLSPSLAGLRARISAWNAYVGILSGFVSALALALAGTFIFQNSVLVSLAPFSALLCSAILTFMVSSPKRLHA